MIVDNFKGVEKYFLPQFLVQQENRVIITLIAEI